MYKTIKRILDLIICLLILPFFFLVCIFVVIGIKIEDKGTIFYFSKRIGLNSKIFDMYKFRSMKVNAPNLLNSDGSSFNNKNDNRVTRFGKYLREYSIDELPQIINVILNDMSIIGPRASGVESMNTFREDEKDKMAVKPGITGYTQAYFRNSLSVREKRLRDVWYAHNVSLGLDVRIFFKTIKTVLNRKNLYTNT
jgi:lipopolysaccharide/colanic/teichoic acid biosynthesis glycosyltransferase